MINPVRGPPRLKGVVGRLSASGRLTSNGMRDEGEEVACGELVESGSGSGVGVAGDVSGVDSTELSGIGSAVGVADGSTEGLEVGAKVEVGIISGVKIGSWVACGELVDSTAHYPEESNGSNPVREQSWGLTHRVKELVLAPKLKDYSLGL